MKRMSTSIIPSIPEFIEYQDPFKLCIHKPRSLFLIQGEGPSENLFEQGIFVLKNQLNKVDHNANLFLIDSIKEFKYFKSLEKEETYDNQIQQISQALTYKALHKHEFVFHIGDPGDYFYIIFKGTADIYVVKSPLDLQNEQQILINIETLKLSLQQANNQEKKIIALDIEKEELELSRYQQPEDLNLQYSRNASIKYTRKLQSGQKISLFKKVKSLESGDCFGEVSLFLNKYRAASILVTSDIHLGQLHKDSYQKIFEKSITSLNFPLACLEKTFVGAERETIIQMSFDFLQKMYSLNQIIFHQDDDIDGLYLIFKGSVELWYHQEEQGKLKSVRLSQIGEGQYFGMAPFFSKVFYNLFLGSQNMYGKSKKSRNYHLFFIQYILQNIEEKKILQVLDSNIKLIADRLYKAEEKWFQSRISKMFTIEKELATSRNQEILKNVKTSNVLKDYITSTSRQLLSKYSQIYDNFSIQPQDILGDKVKKERFFQIKSYTRDIISYERINSIVKHNQRFTDNSEKLPDNVSLCTGMKTFDDQKKRLKFLRYHKQVKYEFSEMTLPMLKFQKEKNDTLTTMVEDQSLIQISPYKSSKRGSPTSQKSIIGKKTQMSMKGYQTERTENQSISYLDQRLATRTVHDPPPVQMSTNNQQTSLNIIMEKIKNEGKIPNIHTHNARSDKNKSTKVLLELERIKIFFQNKKSI